MGRPRTDPVERFFAQVVKSPGCWEWNGWKDKDGYGGFKVDGRMKRAHRYSWELHGGKIPPGICVLHSCDNPGCVNPSHLSLGTVQDNNADRDRKGRTARGENCGSVIHREKVQEGLMRWQQENPHRKAKGERCHTAKLSAPQVIEIRRLRKNGSTYQSLATSYEVSISTIEKACNGKSWKHLYEK